MATATETPAETTTETDPRIDLRSVDDIDRLRRVLLRVARRIRTRSNNSITPSQLAVLGTIIRNEQLTVKQIAEREHVKPPSVSKIVAALEQTGYVERRVDPQDRRCSPLVATPAGHAYAEAVRAAGRTWLAERVDDLDDDDIAAIEHAMPALERLLGTHT